MPARCVTLEQAKGHLNIATPAGHVDDPKIQLKLDAAEAAIFRYIARNEPGKTYVDAWLTPELIEPDAQATILILLSELWRFRGDDSDLASERPSRWPDADLPPVVIGMLRRFTDPVLA